MSMFRQLYPGMKWGMVTVVMFVKDLEEKAGRLYYNMLRVLWNEQEHWQRVENTVGEIPRS